MYEEKLRVAQDCAGILDSALNKAAAKKACALRRIQGFMKIKKSANSILQSSLMNRLKDRKILTDIISSLDIEPDT